VTGKPFRSRSANEWQLVVDEDAGDETVVFGAAACVWGAGDGEVVAGEARGAVVPCGVVIAAGLAVAAP